MFSLKPKGMFSNAIGIMSKHVQLGEKQMGNNWQALQNNNSNDIM